MKDFTGTGGDRLFGFLSTFGFYSHELFVRIKKCHYLIATGKRLEAPSTFEDNFGAAPGMSLAA
jgi:hypothetical protein